jgi:hypothetical protein
MRAKSIALLLVLAGVLSACGGDGGTDGPSSAGDKQDTTPSSFATPFSDADIYPVFVSSEIVAGPNRFLIGLLDSNDAPSGSPEIKVDVAFYDLEESSEDPVFEESTRFVWIVEKQDRGLYVAYPEFPHAGDWGAEVTISGAGYDEQLRAGFQVADASTTPAVGDKVPASDTATASSAADIKKISTDDDPDPRFYETSIAEAIERGEPFVAVFATPKFCASAVCGPTLDDVEPLADDFPDITFIHTEIYTDNDPTKPPLQQVIDWGLPSEPWVFVVDGDGRLVAKFEGSAPPQELRPVLEELE